MPSAFQPLQIIYGNDDEPWAEQYKFGWTIIGPVCLDNRGSENCATVNCITIQRGDLLNFQLANRYQLLRKTCSLFHHKELFERLDFTTANQTDDAAGLLWIYLARNIPGTEKVNKSKTNVLLVFSSPTFIGANQKTGRCPSHSKQTMSPCRTIANRVENGSWALLKPDKVQEHSCRKS